MRSELKQMLSRIIRDNGNYVSRDKAAEGLREFTDMERRLAEAEQVIIDFSAGGQHDAGCIGAYEGREKQCRCTMRDARAYLTKHRPSDSGRVEQ